MVSDSTGETAQRLVQALEAQFPDQEFLEIRHPRVETVTDLQLAVDRMKGRAGGRRLHARRAGAPRVDAHALPKREAPLLRPARPSDRGGREGLGQAARMTPRARPPLDDAYFRRMSAIEFAVKYDDGVGSGLQTRTSCSSVSRARPRRRSRSTSATSATRPRTFRSSRGSTRRPSCSTSSLEGRRPHDRRARGCRRSAASGSAGCAAIASYAEPGRDLRRARIRDAGASSPRLPAASR